MIRPNLIVVVTLLVALPSFFGLTRAQGLRDPTVPPPEAGVANTAAGSSVTPGAMTIIVREGRPYLALGTRLYAQGETLGQARVERITETEVWLREGGVVRKLSQFSGIERRAVKSPAIPLTEKSPTR